MNFLSFKNGIVPASVNLSQFQGQTGVDEYHLIIHPTEYGNIETQLGWLKQAEQNAIAQLGLDSPTAVFRRFFCSDLINQFALVNAEPFSLPGTNEDISAVSWIGQPSIPPVKIVLWSYHISDRNNRLDKIKNHNSVTLNRGKLSHHWTTGIVCLNSETTHTQTRSVFEQYQAFLQSQNMTLADNVIRTWFFVKNIDANYQGLVVVRREFFAEHGLTPETHYIASTGIEGAYFVPTAKVMLDAYSISGVHREQISFLQSLDHLSPTDIYGVTFERGTAVAYRDRKHIFISGTASIDREGKILYPGDIKNQFARTVENVESLLQSAGAGIKDMSLFIVYVRDPSDYLLARNLMQERFGDIPFAIMNAPVCRPGWLIEIEGQAIIPASEPTLSPF